ncbi:pyrroline-5-carboxylate reductase [Acidocella sp.]|uniref:pyrroline-5-carboxylate reductase n=1 Tax=Acidocella sp. TaxID=50710 RepID=UPI00260FA41D|nr:pyrroline-5-carboxylate reductase [Acidocella sp.]
MTTLPSILLVGGGRMGSAMLAGWREQGLSQAVIVDPSPEAAKLAGPGITVVADATEIPFGFTPEAIILAVKPQMAAAVLPAYARFAAHALVISIMAGKTIHAIAQSVGREAAIVRAMPNTPAAVRQGITVAYPCSHVAPHQRELAHALLAATGAVAWISDEAQLDAVTAISGGGPAYVFLLTELMEQAGLDQGLPPELARQLARQTVIGSAALLAASDEDAATLRINVTSPGGTTAEALKLLRADDALPEIFRKAIAAATERSRALSA